MTLGYSISIPDNDHYMYENLKLPPCAKYMDVYSINMYNSNFKFRNRKLNVSETWDGFVIVSDLFKIFCEKESYSKLEFIVLPASKNFYWLKVHNIKEFDVDARKTQFIDYNEKCDGFAGVYGATPVCLKQKLPLEDGFYRTDICFGDFEKKSPVHLVGELTRQKLKSAGFKEISFKPILSEYVWQKGNKDPNELIT